MRTAQLSVSENCMTHFVFYDLNERSSPTKLVEAHEQISSTHFTTLLDTCNCNKRMEECCFISPI